jgi:exodeoxyribonuclease-3
MDNIRKIKLEEEGFESDERTSIEELLELGLNDAYRYLYPESVSFTHWPNKNRITDKNKNKGARLDYFFMEDGIMPWICDVIHHPEITGSDHCPIELDLEVKHEITK